MPQEQHDPGNFTFGLVFGALAGMAGMFLFGTKKGEKTLERLKKKWQVIKPKVEAELEQRGAELQRSRKPFSQAVGEVVDYLADSLESGEKHRKHLTNNPAKHQSQPVRKRYFKASN